MQTFQKNSLFFADIHTDSLTGNRSLIAQAGFSSGDVICDFHWNRTLALPTYLTVQITENQHIELLPAYLECINHSCDPNCFFDTTRRKLVCLETIEPGDEFAFFYPSSEWQMEQFFVCQCGSEHCIQVVEGAKYLSSVQRQKYKFTDFINKKFTLEDK